MKTIQELHKLNLAGMCQLQVWVPADYCFAGVSFAAMFARQKEEMKKAGKMKEA